MIQKFYVVYGFIVLAGLAVGEYYGWTPVSVNQMKNVPKSVRDNPGSYRSIYGGYHHYVGGK